MTTKAFNRTAGAIARAMNAAKSVHCAPPAYKPLQDVKGTTPCTMKACPGIIKFTVRASDGASSGKCSQSGCLAWSE